MKEWNYQNLIITLDLNRMLLRYHEYTPHNTRYMQSFSTSYLSFEWDSETSLLTTLWHTTSEMPDEDYRQTMRYYLHLVQSYHPRLVMVDARNSQYAVPLETQDWINANIYPPAVAAGVKRLAFVVSEDFYVQLSLEIIVNDTNKMSLDDNFQQGFFKTIAEAEQWLLR